MDLYPAMLSSCLFRAKSHSLGRDYRILDLDLVGYILLLQYSNDETTQDKGVFFVFAHFERSFVKY